MHPRFKKKKKEKTDKGKDVVKQLTTIKDPNDDCELKNQRHMFPSLAKPNKEPGELSSKDTLMKEVDDIMSQFEHAVKKSKSQARLVDEWDNHVGARDEPLSKRQHRNAALPPPSRWNTQNGRDMYSRRPQMDDRPVLQDIQENSG
jgi:ATP-dependent RNA helicase DHX8/PRP22